MVNVMTMIYIVMTMMASILGGLAPGGFDASRMRAATTFHDRMLVGYIYMIDNRCYYAIGTGSFRSRGMGHCSVPYLPSGTLDELDHRPDSTPSAC
jgi:hypothetical protein